LNSAQETPEHGDRLVTFSHQVLLIAIRAQNQPRTIGERCGEVFPEHTDEFTVGIFYEIAAMDIEYFLGTKCERKLVALLVGIEHDFFFERKSFLLRKAHQLVRRTCRCRA
jgi:hypothetical protein